MEIPKLVKPFPKFVKYLPVMKHFTGVSWYPYILLKPEIYYDLKSLNPNATSIAILSHELKHRERQIEQGFLLFGIKYFFSPEFRFQEELEAYYVSMEIYRKNGLIFDTESIARAFSGSIYLWAKSYTEAKQRLEEMWANAK